MTIPCNSDELLNRFLNLGSYASKNLHFSYKLFFDYFSIPRSHSEIYLGAYMVYGWMPTMLRLKGPAEYILWLHDRALEKKLSPQLLSLYSKAINNSIVGSSKFVHFVNPHYYPIWDSRVYRTLFSKEPHPYRVEDPNLYFDYIDFVHQLCKHPLFGVLQKQVSEEAGYPLLGPRVIELCLYSVGGKPNKKEKKLV